MAATSESHPMPPAFPISSSCCVFTALALLAGVSRGFAAEDGAGANGSTPVVATAPVSAVSTPAKGLHFAEAPAKLRQEVETGVKISNRRLVIADFEMKPPVAVYHIDDWRDFVLSGNFTSASLSAYYCPVMVQGQLQVMQVRAPSIALRTDFQFGAAMPNPNDGVFDAIQTVSQLEKVKSGEFEARLLIFDYYVNAGPTQVLWVKSLSGKDDLVYVVRGAGSKGRLPELRGKTVYTVDEFVAKFREANPKTSQRAQQL
jgi:hypothetical protein